MKLSQRLFFAVLGYLLLGVADSALGDDAPSQMWLKTYTLHNSPHSADLSPDGQLVVTESVVQTETANLDRKHIAEVVQVWNFKEDKLVAEARLLQADVQASTTEYLPEPNHNARIVKFSPDGSIVVALIHQTIYVLNSKNLATLQTISIADLVGTARDRTKISFELSPSGDVAAVLWTTKDFRGRVALYNVSSGKFVRSWETPSEQVAFTRGLAWDRDGKLLLIATRTSDVCESPDIHPDIFVFDSNTGILVRKFRTGLAVGSVALVLGERVFAVDENCIRAFKNHDSKLRVFDFSKGMKVREVSGRSAGVRYEVSASANGNRFVAFTGIVKLDFDWSDMTPGEKVVDETFTVWNAADYSVVTTSQNIPGLRLSSLRISANGKYVVSYGKASFVYELP